MRSRLLAVVVVASCGGHSGSVSSPHVRMTAKDIVQKSTPAIVRIEAGGDKLGTGFILDKGGLIATNLHVVAGESQIEVTLYDGSKYTVQTVAGVDPGRDLAILRILPKKPLAVLRLGDSSAMTAGDQIVTIGNPLGMFDYSVSNGLVSQVRPVCSQQEVEAHNRELPLFKTLLEKPNRTPDEEQKFQALKCVQELTVLQISAPISQGSSGGPLFNQFGEVVGVTTAIIATGQNINLAVPTNYLKPLVQHPAAIALDEFAKDTRGNDEHERHGGGDPDDGVRITRQIPNHPLSALDGCKAEDIGEIVQAISDAIDSGAPLYNDGNHKACFQIYEGTAVKFEHDAPCPGVRAAFGDGLLRAQQLTSWKEKAWAMRDTFDGMIDVSRRWVEKNGMHGKGAIKPSPKK
jgi:serine protease Do